MLNNVCNDKYLIEIVLIIVSASPFESNEDGMFYQLIVLNTHYYTDIITSFASKRNTKVFHYKMLFIAVSRGLIPEQEKEK